MEMEIENKFHWHAIFQCGTVEEHCVPGMSIGHVIGL